MSEKQKKAAALLEGKCSLFIYSFIHLVCGILWCGHLYLQRHLNTH